MSYFPSEIQELVTEYKDSNYIRVSNGKMTICSDFYSETNVVQNEVKVRNGLYAITVSPMIFSGSNAYRCYIIYNVDHLEEVEQLSHISLSFVPPWFTLEQLTISSGGITREPSALTINMGKPINTCIGSYDCPCRFTQADTKEFNGEICSFCYHNKTQHPAVRPSIFGSDLLIVPTGTIISYISPKIYGNENCLILPIYYYGYDFSNIISSFFNRAHDDLEKAYQTIIGGKKHKGSTVLANQSFAIPEGKSVRSYFPTITTQGNRIYVQDNGIAQIKKGQKIIQRVNIDKEGTQEIKEFSALLRRRHLISLSNITHYPYLIELQKQIMNDPLYKSDAVITIADNWLEYTITNKSN